MNKFGEIKIRPMLLRDLPNVLAIENTRDDLPWPEHTFHDCIEMGAVCLVVEKDNFLIAYAIMLFIGDEAHIFNICVIPEEQQKGYGGRIMQHLLKTARHHKSKRVLLKVRESKKNIHHFYHKLGFCTVGYLVDYYDILKDKEAALILELKLKRK